MPLIGYAKQEYNKRYRGEHQEDLRDYLKVYRENHKEELRQKNRLYKLKHRKDILLKERTRMRLKRTKKNDLVLCQCRVCDRLFYVPRSLRTNNRYCGEKCRAAGAKDLNRRWQLLFKGLSSGERRMKICKNCGCVFMRPTKRSVKYCSEKCRKEGYRKDMLKSQQRKRKWLAMAGVTKPFISKREIAIEKEIRTDDGESELGRKCSCEVCKEEWVS